MRALAMGSALAAQFGLIAGAVLGFGDQAFAQALTPPADARNLVVHIRSYIDGAVHYGAGIVLGAYGNGTLVIGTAYHVVELAKQRNQEIWVTFASAPSESLLARVERVEGTLDFAVLLVPPSGSPPPVAPAWNRLGNPRSLTNDDVVVPIGCPNGLCWQPQSPVSVLSARGQHIRFESYVVSRGSSGGGLFNSQWELVGMVLEQANIQGTALSINTVVDLADSWEFPVALKTPSVPRAGYRTHVSGGLLAGMGSEATNFPDGRIPSGRITLTRQGGSLFAYHVSGLRLAQDNLTVSAVVGGASVDLRRGRLSALPFIEFGFGRVEGRFDQGGYFVANPSAPGGNEYVPFWQQVKEDGIGVGGGLNLSYLIVPHIGIEVTAAHWSFSIPTSLPDEKLPNLFLGAGLRFGF